MAVATKMTCITKGLLSQMTGPRTHTTLSPVSERQTEAAGSEPSLLERRKQRQAQGAPALTAARVIPTRFFSCSCDRLGRAPRHVYVHRLETHSNS